MAPLHQAPLESAAGGPVPYAISSYCNTAASDVRLRLCESEPGIRAPRI
ncbi:hypothetical protein [Rubinisphaera sp.]|nr:hypothetical protein [Rubinisphaera sp.]